MTEEIKSVGFEVKKWQHNPAVKLENLQTSAELLTYALRDSENNDVAGIAFKWILVISSNNIEVIYFACEEMFAIPGKRITLENLDTLIHNSYAMAYGEAAVRNMSVGIRSSFPDIKKIPYDLNEIIKVFEL